LSERVRRGLADRSRSAEDFAGALLRAGVFEELEEPVDGLGWGEPGAGVAEFEVVAPAFLAPGGAEFPGSPLFVGGPPTEERFAGEEDFVRAAAAEAGHFIASGGHGSVREEDAMAAADVEQAGGLGIVRTPASAEAVEFDPSVFALDAIKAGAFAASFGAGDALHS